MNQLKSTEQLLDLLWEQLTDQAVCLLDVDGHVVDWNAGAARFFRLPFDPTGSAITGLFKDLHWAQVTAAAFRAGTFECECQLISETVTVPVSLIIKPIYDDNYLTGYGLHCRSLYYERNAGKSLLAPTSESLLSGGLFQQLIDRSQSGVSLFDKDLNIIYRSPSVARITGFSDDARSGSAVNDMIHPSDQPRIKMLIDEIRRSPGKPLSATFRSRHFDGHFIYLQCTFTNWLNEPGIEAIVLNLQDVTNQELAKTHHEQTSRELTAYRYALDEAAIVSITDQNGDITYVNDNFCLISGYQRDELLGKNQHLINSDPKSTKSFKGLWRTIASGNIWRGEFQNRAKDGDLYWVASTIVPFLNQQGQPYQYMSISFDITAAKIADEELRHKSSELSGILEGISDGFVTLNNELLFTYVNERLCEIIGLRPEELLGKYVWDIYGDAVDSITYHAIEKARTQRVAVISEDYYPGLDLWQECRIYPVETGLAIFLSDITERKHKESRQQLFDDITHIFNEQEKMGASLRLALHKVLAFSGAQVGEAWLTSVEANQLYLITKLIICEKGITYVDLSTEERLVKIGEGLPGLTWQAKAAQFEQSTQTDGAYFHKESAKHISIKNVISIPLQDEEQVVGVLILGLQTGRPASLTDALLQQLGAHLGAEIKRKQLKRELQRVFESVPDIICIVGTDRKFKRVNKAMLNLTGYSEDEILRKTISDLIHPDDLDASVSRMKRFSSGDLESQHFTNRYVKKDGSVIHLSWTVRKAAEKGILFCVAKDVTEEKRLEELLWKANQLARIGSWDINLQNAEVYWSPITTEILEVNTNFRATPENISLFCGPKELKQLNKAMADVVHKRLPFDLELELNTAAGTRRWVRILGEGEYLGNVCTRIYGSLQDIDTRKRAQIQLLQQAKELAASGQRYTELFHISPLPKFVFDTETLAYLDVNEAALEHYGYTREEFLKMTIRDIRPPEELVRLEEVLNNKDRSDYKLNAGSFTHIKKNGELMQVEIVSSKLTYKGRPARLALAIDVTERNKHLTEIEAQNQRLRDISWMQSHVLRAPLTRIMGLVNLLRDNKANAHLSDQIMEYLQVSTAELDEVIREISDNATGRVRNPPIK